MLEKLKEKVLKANLMLVKHGLVIFTWGNVSAIDKDEKLIVIKPSGVSYETMKSEDMVVVDLNCKVIEGELNPSSDTPTHIELYKANPEIGGIVHTHSTYATAFAQSGKYITALGTTHADYFYGDIPCTRALTEKEIKNNYEKNTGLVINKTFENNDIMAVPACLVRNHGPFAWGMDADNAVHNAVVLEEIAKMAILTKQINYRADRVNQYLLDKHYKRKHGKNEYYGQKRG
jgi:L-ribulose-5-phosphate 4-epimerase